MSGGPEFWDREVVSPQHVAWTDEPAIHEYTLRLIGGGTPVWPVAWFQSWLGGRRFKRALSIGCGTGPLERGFINLDLVDTIDAFDGSITSLHTARAEAAAAGMSHRIRYFAADFNRVALPGAKYDLVLFHQSAHHVENLERLFASILRALTPDGLLYLDEYVGPSRFDWNRRLIEPQRAFFRTLPESLKAAPEIPYPIQADDPSEAVRSSEIESRVEIGFEILERKPYGGTLLAVVYPMLRRDNITPDVVTMLTNAEKKLLNEGVPSFYTVIVAKPRANRPRAQLHYAMSAPVAELRLRGRKVYARAKMWARRHVLSRMRN